MIRAATRWGSRRHWKAPRRLYHVIASQHDLTALGKKKIRSWVAHVQLSTLKRLVKRSSFIIASLKVRFHSVLAASVCASRGPGAGKV